jgi:hypothetical protein
MGLERGKCEYHEEMMMECAIELVGAPDLWTNQKRSIGIVWNFPACFQSVTTGAGRESREIGVVS